MRFAGKRIEREVSTLPWSALGRGSLLCAGRTRALSVFLLGALSFVGMSGELDASTFDRGLLKGRGLIPEPEKRSVPYLADMKNPQLGYIGKAEVAQAHSMATGTVVLPTLGAFQERYAKIIEEENAPPPPPPEPEPVVVEDDEPKRRVVVRSEFDIEGDAPGSFPRPERDTVSFEDIYMFFPVNEGDSQRVGLVRGGKNGTLFSPPASSGLKSGVTFETISR